MRRCIITCGPTYEPLDQVRRLTNFSTGKLGVELANYLVAQGCEVTLLKGVSATYPGKCEAQQLIPFTTTDDLAKKLAALASPEVGAVFHAAAVSDFKFGTAIRWEKDKGVVEVKSGKFSTRELPLFVELIPTPKILPQLRGWFPKAEIVGWKYEVDGDRESVLAKGRAQLAEAQSTVCVLNGPAYGEGFGFLANDRVKHLPNASELYELLWAFCVT